MEFITNLILIIIAFCLWFFLVVYHFYRINKIDWDYIKPVKKHNNIIKDIFFNIPKQIGIDKAMTDPNTFNEFGIIVFTGEQGQGKTISMMEYAIKLKGLFPKCVICSNTNFSLQDKVLDDWHILTDFHNGVNGCVAILDECQAWFNSKMSKDLPMSMVECITQNRKNRRVLLCTAQSYYMLAKDFRCLCKEIRECHTFFGCLTVVFRKKPIIDSSGDVVKLKNLGFYYFIHTDKLRNSYDTLATIKSLSKSGFVERIKLDER